MSASNDAGVHRHLAFCMDKLEGLNKGTSNMLE